MSQNYIPLHIYLNPERDADILTWLESQKNKSAAVREALAVYLQVEVGEQRLPAQVALDPTTIYQAMSQALQEHLDLDFLRQIVEATVRRTLSGPVSIPTTAPEDEAEALLSSLDTSLDVD